MNTLGRGAGDGSECENPRHATRLALPGVFPFQWTYVESLTTLAPPHEPCVPAGGEGFTGHRSDRRNPVLWTLGASRFAHLG